MKLYERHANVGRRQRTCQREMQLIAAWSLNTRHADMRGHATARSSLTSGPVLQ